MPEYIVSGRGPRGRRVTEWFEAASADEAVRSFDELGYRDIVLHTDDVAAIHLHRAKIDKKITARDYVAMRRGGGRYLFWVFWLYRLGWKTTAAFLALLTLRRAGEGEWTWWDWLLLGMVLAPFPVAAGIKLASKGHLYWKVMDARSWGRWAEMLDLIGPLEGKVAADEFTFRKAQAIAGLGRLDEAEALVAPFADGSAIPEWYYWSRLADVYGVAQRVDRLIEAQETAARLAPANTTVLIDLALVLVRYRRDTRRARSLLDRARSHAISDIAESSVDAVEGLVALEEKDPVEARQRLERAIAGLKPFRPGNPFVGLVLDRNHAYLSLACAGEGDRAAAERHFRRAEPRLLAVGFDDLRERCRQAVGV
jgi:tetratricopeptide (TPR) repeat protein